MIGYKIIEEEGFKWRINQKGLMPLTPPDKNLNIKSEISMSLMQRNSALYIRWESSFDMIKSSSWWHVICDESIEIESLSKNTRSKVRRGLKYFDSEMLTRQQVLDEGYKIYSSAFARYETHEEKFNEKQFLAAISNMPKNTEFWGVREKNTGKLVAFSENYIDHDICFCNTIWFEPDALKSYSSYVFFYNLIQHYLKQRCFNYISNGAMSISHETQIHSFLESKFGFRKAYAVLHVRYQFLLHVCVLLLYPFRKLIALIPFKIFKMATIFLKQEEIHRNCNS